MEGKQKTLFITEKKNIKNKLMYKEWDYIVNKILLRKIGSWFWNHAMKIFWIFKKNTLTENKVATPW